MDCMSMGSQSRMWLSHFHFHLVPFLNALSSSLFVTAVFFTFIVFHLFRVWNSNYMFWQMNLGQSINSHSSILAWRIPWTWEPVGYSLWGCREPNTTEWPSTCTYTHSPHFKWYKWQKLLFGSLLSFLGVIEETENLQIIFWQFSCKKAFRQHFRVNLAKFHTSSSSSSIACIKYFVDNT